MQSPQIKIVLRPTEIRKLKQTDVVLFDKYVKTYGPIDDPHVVATQMEKDLYDDLKDLEYKKALPPQQRNVAVAEFESLIPQYLAHKAEEKELFAKMRINLVNAEKILANDAVKPVVELFTERLGEKNGVKCIKSLVACLLTCNLEPSDNAFKEFMILFSQKIQDETYPFDVKMMTTFNDSMVQWRNLLKTLFDEKAECSRSSLGGVACAAASDAAFQTTRLVDAPKSSAREVGAHWSPVNPLFQAKSITQPSYKNALSCTALYLQHRNIFTSDTYNSLVDALKQMMIFRVIYTPPLTPRQFEPELMSLAISASKHNALLSFALSKSYKDLPGVTIMVNACSKTPIIDASLHRAVPAPMSEPPMSPLLTVKQLAPSRTLHDSEVLKFKKKIKELERYGTKQSTIATKALSDAEYYCKEAEDYLEESTAAKNPKAMNQNAVNAGEAAVNADKAAKSAEASYENVKTSVEKAGKICDDLLSAEIDFFASSAPGLEQKGKFEEANAECKKNFEKTATDTQKTATDARAAATDARVAANQAQDAANKAQVAANQTVAQRADVRKAAEAKAAAEARAAADNKEVSSVVSSLVSSVATSVVEDEQKSKDLQEAFEAGRRRRTESAAAAPADANHPSVTGIDMGDFQTLFVCDYKTMIEISTRIRDLTDESIFLFLQSNPHLSKYMLFDGFYTDDTDEVLQFFKGGLSGRTFLVVGILQQYIRDTTTLLVTGKTALQLTAVLNDDRIDMVNKSYPPLPVDKYTAPGICLSRLCSDFDMSLVTAVPATPSLKKTFINTILLFFNKRGIFHNIESSDVPSKKYDNFLISNSFLTILSRGAPNTISVKKSSGSGISGGVLDILDVKFQTYEENHLIFPNLEHLEPTFFQIDAERLLSSPMPDAERLLSSPMPDSMLTLLTFRLPDLLSILNECIQIIIKELTKLFTYKRILDEEYYFFVITTLLKFFSRAVQLSYMQANKQNSTRWIFFTEVARNQTPQYMIPIITDFLNLFLVGDYKLNAEIFHYFGVYKATARLDWETRTAMPLHKQILDILKKKKNIPDFISPPEKFMGGKKNKLKTKRKAMKTRKTNKSKKNNKKKRLTINKRNSGAKHCISPYKLTNKSSGRRTRKY